MRDPKRDREPFGRREFAFCGGGRDVVDGLVNLVGRGGVRVGDASGAHDHSVVDGIVRFVGDGCQRLGAGFSALQSGRVRLYLSLSVGALALALLLEHIL